MINDKSFYDNRHSVRANVYFWYMYRKITATRIYTVSGNPLENSVLLVDATGRIMDIKDSHEFDTAELEVYPGVIVPGFVNAHCHLELSHLKGIAQTGTGLIDFITQVISNRHHSTEEIQYGIEQAEKQMIDSGIVAVGDICNTTDTFAQKQKEHLFYYSFVEYFDLFQQEKTAGTIAQYDAVYNALAETTRLKKSKVPHAPYSVSEELFEYILKAATGKTISIHNQETQAEEDLFSGKKGDFIRFYEKMQIETHNIPFRNHASIYYALEYLNKANRNLLVHNTLSKKEDIQAAMDVLGAENTFWCTCPNANLYIENLLPDYRALLATKALVCVGTDSLTSNWQLNILEEMKTILKYCSYLDFETVLKWATLNGAKALGIDHQYGTIEVGKTPGLVWIENMGNDGFIGDAKSKKIS